MSMSRGLTRRALFELEPGHIPIVFYVNERPEYFVRVLAALREVRGINRTRLYVSHDNAAAEMVALVAAVDFCQVVSLLHPVPPHPPATAHLKSHWRWLQAEVWERRLPHYSGYVLFLEEDHLPSADLYETLRLLVALQPRLNTSSLALGSYGLEAAGATALMTYPGFLNTGYAFNRSLYARLQAHAELFEAADDDWDSALAVVLAGDWQLSPRLARLRNIGGEGLHRTQTYYDLAEAGRQPRSDGAPLAGRVTVTAYSHDTSPPHANETLTQQLLLDLDLALPAY